MLGVRDLLIKQRTMLIMRCAAMRREFGVTAAKGPNKIVELLQRLATGKVCRTGREMLGMLASQLEAVNGKLKAIEARLMAWHRQTRQSVPGYIPGSGRSPASASHSNPDARAFARPGTLRRGLDHAARELTQETPARQDQPRGRRKLRRLLVLGATAVMPAGQRVAPRRGSWIAGAPSQKARSGSRWPTKWPRHLGHE